MADHRRLNFIFPAFVLAAFTAFAACGDDDAPADPDAVAEAYCQTMIDCFEDMGEGELDDCISEMTADYAHYADERGAQCRDALLETDQCLSRQSCEDIRDNVACSAEFDREEEACFNGEQPD